MDIKKSSLLERGELKLTSLDVERYDSDCDSLIKEIGDLVTKYTVVSSEKGYLLVFFPFGRDNIINLTRSQNTTCLGEPLIRPLFSINYDRDLKFESYKKGESKIPTKMNYMIMMV